MAHHTLLLALLITSFAPPSPAPEITMPRVIEHTLSEARVLLEKSGWHGTLTLSPSTAGPAMTVSMQDLVGGTQVAADRPLTLVMRPPPGPPTMMNLLHQPKGRAEMLIHRAGFLKNLTWKTAPAPTPYEVDNVIAQSVPPGTLLTKDLKIELTIGEAAAVKPKER